MAKKESELQLLRVRIDEAEETLEAIRSGEVEALLVCSRGRDVTIRQSASEEGSPFAFEEAVLAPDGELSYLLVRPMA